jgi:hypothetical protein
VSDNFVDRHFLRPAKEDGDWEALATLLESDFEITPDIRAFLAKILREEVKRKKKRPPKARTKTRTAFVFDLKQKGVRNHIARAEEFFLMDRRGVQRAVECFPTMNAKLADLVLVGSPRFRRRP